jgi:hypothetical protein
MSFELRRNRIESLKKWKCVKVHDLITSFKIPDDSLEQLKNAVKNYISKAMLISFEPNDDSFIKIIDKSRNLNNITPNGAVVPKREYLLEYNIFIREWTDIMKNIVKPAPEILNRFRLTPNIRIKFSEEIEENKNRDLNTSLPHSDGWLEGPWGMNCFMPLFGDTSNNTLKYFQPKPGSFKEEFVQINPSYKDMQWVLEYYEDLDFIPEKNKIYFSDYSMIHKTHKYKENSGTRISIDTTLYIGDNPPHPDRELEYEKDFLNIGIDKVIDPGLYSNEKNNKLTTFSHYTSGKRKIINL